MSTSASSTLTFPHPTLSPIPDKPTNATLQILQRELYANARAIHSTRGGGAHGHLTIIMPTADYLARVGQTFNTPNHPGNAPVHAAPATQAQITETNRQYAADLAEHTLYQTVTMELKKQILAAVPNRYLNILADDDMGFADVTCATMLAHLKDTYGNITREELEINRNRLSAEWNPEYPMEDLWLRIREVQRYANAGQEEITDATVLRLTLPVLENTGVFLSATERWREKDDAAWTMTNFQDHFNKADKERLRKLTAQTAGYHGAHAATDTSPPLTTPPNADAAAPFSMHSDGCVMWYCWSHGLGKNRSHTSMTCQRKSPGHQDTATVDMRMGGNNTIMGSRPNRPGALTSS